MKRILQTPWFSGWLKTAQSKGSTRVDASLPEEKAKPASEMSCFFRTYTIKIQKKKTVSESYTTIKHPQSWTLSHCTTLKSITLAQSALLYNVKCKCCIHVTISLHTARYRNCQAGDVVWRSVYCFIRLIYIRHVTNSTGSRLSFGIWCLQSHGQIAATLFTNLPLTPKPWRWGQCSKM